MTAESLPLVPADLRHLACSDGLLLGLWCILLFVLRFYKVRFSFCVINMLILFSLFLDFVPFVSPFVSFICMRWSSLVYIIYINESILFFCLYDLYLCFDSLLQFISFIFMSLSSLFISFIFAYPLLVFMSFIFILRFPSPVYFIYNFFVYPLLLIISFMFTRRFPFPVYIIYISALIPFFRYLLSSIAFLMYII